MAGKIKKNTIMKDFVLIMLLSMSLITSGQGQTIELVQPGSRFGTVTGTVPVSNGGTGATSSANAFNAIAPSKTGNALKFLRVNAGATDYELVTLAGGGDALTSAPLNQFAATTSDQLRGIISNPTGTGSLVFGTSPTLTTPNIGVATATSINGNTFTTGTYTLTGTAGKTLTFNNSITLAGTDGTTMTFPGTSATLARTDAANTFTGVQTFSSAPVLSTGTATVGGNTITFPVVASTLLPNTTTSGVAATPTASGTVTVTHNLGRVPTIIRIYSISSFTSNAAATPVPFSMGTWNSTGNRCLYMTSNGTTTQVSQTSSVFAVFLATSAGNNISGVIQNVTSTGFDIVFTETGTHTNGNYLWEAQ